MQLPNGAEMHVFLIPPRFKLPRLYSEEQSDVNLTTYTLLPHAKLSPCRTSESIRVSGPNQARLMGDETWEGEVLTTLQLAHNEECFPLLLGSGSPALLQPVSLFFFLLFIYLIFFLMSTQQLGMAS